MTSCAVAGWGKTCPACGVLNTLLAVFSITLLIGSMNSGSFVGLNVCLSWSANAFATSSGD